MRLGIYADPHYSSQALTCSVRFNSRSLDKIREAYRFFEREKCDLCVCLGDLIDKEKEHSLEIENLKKVSDIIGSSSVPTVCLMGNHDAFAFTKEEFYDILGWGTLPLDRNEKGKSLVFLDACYFKSGARYMPGDTDWTDTYCPFEEKLREDVSFATGDVYVFVHQNLDPAVEKRHLVSNAESINGILFGSQKVKAVFQGHYHPGCRNVYNGIRYVTFPAMCESDGAYFIEEL
ncbi:MAG: metallophosphoesterase [Clostridia bacterium]|nr:metallophosphoesterase [Clostridia bacterium]